jgi:uncharacterized membrane protein HdeD (DUF308 family)
MADNRPGNTPTEPENQPENPAPGNKDWRQERREWREARRERRNRDPWQGLFWGLVLIMVGVLFFINQQSGIGWDVLWKYVLVGLGAIFIIEGLVRLLSANHRDTSYGRFIPGVILLFVGIAFLYGFNQWWPVVLIAVGVIILLSLLFRRNRS